MLAETAELSDDSVLVLSGAFPGRLLSDNTHANSASAFEETHTPHTVMEVPVAHTITNKAEDGYARSNLFEKRRALIKSWAGVSGPLVAVASAVRTSPRTYFLSLRTEAT